MFNGLGIKAYLFQKHELAYNHHKFGIDPSLFKDNEYMRENYRMIATSIGEDGNEYVAAYEHLNYPFYGVQFHPEKQGSVFYRSAPVDNRDLSVQLNKHFAQFFVS